MTISAGRKADPFLVVSIALLVIAVLAAAFFAYEWIMHATDEDAQYSAARDDTQRIGSQLAVNFTSLDYQKLDEFKQRMSDNTTGALHDTIGKTIDQYRKSVVDGKVNATSTVVDSVVLSLDLRQNKASVLTVVNSSSQSANSKGNAASQRLPVVIGLTRQDADSPWKAESVSGSPTVGG